ncbi:hypothetical protein H4582DRAFT_2059326 [Lactarius indigo]|nr:hypothetical protein H4582DRAFT_2059326 [Lactarius indigo]
MDPSSSDDECVSVQLSGSDMAPRAMKTILRQRFPMRRYHLESDGRLSNVVKAMDRSVENAATCTTAPVLAASHTLSSPSMPLIARAMSSLAASDLGSEDLSRILSAQLDSLAVSPQTKQSIVPALLGIAKLAKVQSQSLPMPISLSPPTAPEPEPVGTTAESSSITLPYQMRQRSFSSSSGSGYTGLVVNGSVSHQERSILSTTIEFSVFVAMESQVGLLGHRPPPQK